MISLIINVVKPPRRRAVKLSKEQAARNRERILTVASRLFRQRGIDNVSVAEVMEAAGFTHGGFYNHFADKGALALEACVTTFARSVSAVQERTAAGLEPYVKTYLSSAHRDGEDGCPITALATEAARHDGLQAAFAEGLSSTVELFTEALQRSGVTARGAARTRAMRLVSEMVGALTLARAVRVAEPQLSSELLRASRHAAES
jgi:TetR/AcrR family transcriptional repressor of nem operon